MQCVQDYRFWLAVLAGPLAWFVLWRLGLPIDHETPPLDIVLRVALLYPVLEELVFRGGIQALLLEKLPRLRRRIATLSIANMTTSILFAGMHLFTHTPLWALLVIPPSLVFGWAMERYGTVVAPILLHVIYNAGFVLLFAN